MEGAYATKYAPDDNITTTAAIEAILSADTPIGRIMDGLSFLSYVLLNLLVLLFSPSSFLLWFLSSELRLMTISIESWNARYLEEQILDFKIDFES
jgi:hypothetical protein